MGRGFIGDFTPSDVPCPACLRMGHQTISGGLVMLRRNNADGTHHCMSLHGEIAPEAVLRSACNQLMDVSERIATLTRSPRASISLLAASRFNLQQTIENLRKELATC